MIHNQIFPWRHATFFSRPFDVGLKSRWTLEQFYRTPNQGYSATFYRVLRGNRTFLLKAKSYDSSAVSTQNGAKKTKGGFFVPFLPCICTIMKSESVNVEVINGVFSFLFTFAVLCLGSDLLSVLFWGYYAWLPEGTFRYLCVLISIQGWLKNTWAYLTIPEGTKSCDSAVGLGDSKWS